MMNRASQPKQMAGDKKPTKMMKKGGKCKGGGAAKKGMKYSRAG